MVAREIAEPGRRSYRPDQVGKNEHYAASIGIMIEYIGELPESDDTLLRLAGVAAKFGEYPDPSETALEKAVDMMHTIHFGPRGKTMNPADCPGDFLAWAETLTEILSKPRCNECGSFLGPTQGSSDVREDECASCRDA